MYIRTIEHRGKGIYQNENIFECDICGEEISDMHPRLEPKENMHICTNCPFNLVEQIFDNKIGGMQWLFWLKEMENKYFSNYRKKRKALNLKLRKEVLNKYNFTCQNCKTNKNLTIDHIKPISKGGTDNPNNLTILCKSCNSKKSNKYEGK